MVYKRKGILVPLAFALAFITLAVIYKKLPEGNQYFAPVILFLAALYNFIFTFLFVGKEEGLSEEKFQEIVREQKERLSKTEFSDWTIKMMRISHSPYSSFDMIRNKNWTYIFFVAAIILFILFSFFNS